MKVKMVFINLVVFVLIVGVLIIWINVVVDDLVIESLSNFLFFNGELGYEFLVEIKVVKFDFEYVFGLLMIIVWIFIVSFVKLGKVFLLFM